MMNGIYPRNIDLQFIIHPDKFFDIGQLLKRYVFFFTGMNKFNQSILIQLLNKRCFYFVVDTKLFY